MSSSSVDGKDPDMARDVETAAADHKREPTLNHHLPPRDAITQRHLSGTWPSHAPADNLRRQDGPLPSFCLVKLRCCGKGRIHPGAAIVVPSTQAASSPGMVHIAAPAGSPTRAAPAIAGGAADHGQSGLTLQFHDPHEIVLCNDDVLSPLPVWPASDGSHEPHCQSGRCSDGAAQDMDSQVSVAVPEMETAEVAGWQRGQHQQRTMTSLRAVIGFVTSCAPEGTPSYHATAMCSLQGLFMAWRRQDQSMDRLPFNRHAGLQLCVHNVRGGPLCTCKPCIVLA